MDLLVGYRHCSVSHLWLGTPRVRWGSCACALYGAAWETIWTKSSLEVKNSQGPTSWLFILIAEPLQQGPLPKCFARRGGWRALVEETQLSVNTERLRSPEMWLQPWGRADLFPESRWKSPALAGEKYSSGAKQKDFCNGKPFPQREGELWFLNLSGTVWKTEVLAFWVTHDHLSGRDAVNIIWSCSFLAS